MNERIKELAEQAKILKEFAVTGMWLADDQELERFAELVAAEEREACAKLCEEFGRNLGGYKAHEDSHDDGWQDACCEIETAIRQRGEK